MVGRESPRATTLPPRRLRAALHPLWHPLELRCACLEPRPALVTCAPTAAFNPHSYCLPARTTYALACVLVHVLSSPISLAGYTPLRPAAMQGARATARSATAASSRHRALLCATVARAPTLPRVLLPATLDHVHALTTRAPAAGTRLVLAVTPPPARRRPVSLRPAPCRPLRRPPSRDILSSYVCACALECARMQALRTAGRRLYGGSAATTWRRRRRLSDGKTARGDGLLWPQGPGGWGWVG